MDFRVVDIDGYQVLLERIEDDGRWQVILSVYLDLTHRFDDWFETERPETIRAIIPVITEAQIREFLEKAQRWYAKRTQSAGLTPS